MNRIIVILSCLLLAQNLSLSGQPDSQDETIQKLQLLKMEVTDNLINNILSYWSEKMPDEINGGFYGRINGKNQVIQDEDKGGILNARILWTYSSVYRVLKDPSYLVMASRANDFIMEHFIDRQHGGAYRSITSKGEPSDTRKQTYTQAFFIYGLSEYYRATGDKKALSAAIDIYQLLEKHALDKEDNGYFEVFSQDWQRIRDRLIGEKTIADEKTMNTHLHIMEAYTSLYRVWPDSRLKEQLTNIIGIFPDKIINKQTSHLICFFDKNWRGTSEIDSYGHDIEASWLICEAAALLKDPELLARVKSTSIKIADAASEGLQPDGSMIYEKDMTTGHINYERSWWPQAETMVGYLNACELSGNKDYLIKTLDCWNFIKENLVDKKAGGWFSSVSASGIISSGDKSGFWICPYHNGRMCLEIIERIPDK